MRKLPCVYTVFLEGIEFYGFHGVPDEERIVGHRYIVHVEAEVDGQAHETDEVSDTVDYGEIAAKVLGVGKGASVRTVERLAKRIGEELLENFPAVRSVEVTVTKPLPPMPHVVDSAGVRIVLER